jgi:hypothetical protein
MMMMTSNPRPVTPVSMGAAKTATSLIRLEIKYSVAIGCQTRHREDVAVPVPTD